MAQHLTPEEAYAQRHPWPDYMVSLGLSPPATEDDVKQVYERTHAELRSDKIGNALAIKELEKAYKRAMEFVSFRSSRRKWLARQVERYVSQEVFIAEVTERGGHVDIESVEWIKHSFGADFAQVADIISGIHFHSSQQADADIEFLVENSSKLTSMRLLNLGASNVSDEGLKKLRVFHGIKYLDIEDTPITMRGLELLEHLEKLEWIRLVGTKVGWWGRFRLKMKYPDINIAVAEPI